MGFLDASSNAYRAIRFIGGHSLDDHDAALVCSLLGLPMTVACVEFAYSFPFNRPAPARLRAIVLSATFIVLAWRLSPGFGDSYQFLQALGHALPLFTLSFVLLVRNLRATT